MRYIAKFLMLITLIIFSACDKDLDLSPRSQLSPSTFWKSGDDWKNWVNRYYPGIGGHGNGALDNNSDLSIGAGPNNVSNGSYLAPQNSGFWDGSYASIRQFNIALEQFEVTTPEIQAEAERFVAELRFFRAWTYFNLLKVYGGVPLIDRVLDLDSEELFEARASRTEIADFILADLDWAASRLPEQSELADAEDGRITVGAVQAFKSRVGLFEGTWQKYHEGGGESNRYLDEAINAANTVINSGEYQLFDDMGDESYFFLFIEEGDESNEVILSRRYSIDLNVTHNTTRWVDTQIGAPTKTLADMYVCTDGLPIEVSPLFEGRAEITAEFRNRDARMSGTIMVPGTIRNVEGNDVEQMPNIGAAGTGVTSTGYQSRKFLSNDLMSQQGAAAFNFIAIRLGEVLLNLAEALYERNGSVSDADLNRSVNLLRERAGVADLTNGLVSANSLDLQQEIRRERTVELAYEGFRYGDLRRWKTAENVLPNSLLGVQFVGTEFETEYADVTPGGDIRVDDDGFIVADPDDTRQFIAPMHYLQPLPLQQIALTGGVLQQNPDW